MRTPLQLKLGMVTAILTLTSCTSYTDLGSNFKLYEYDRDDVYIGYCFNRCDVSSIMVVPPTVIKVDHDADWIVARTRGAPGEPVYWVVDKSMSLSFRRDRTLSDSLRSSVRGPLVAAEFASVLEEEGIALSLRG